MRVLVTGASGFIGANAVRALLGAGYAVRAFVRKPSPPSLQGLEIEFALGDCRDPIAASEAARGCAAIVHAAALFELSGYPPRAYYDVNVRGTANLIAAARRNDVERFLYVSSIATVQPRKDRQPADESGFRPPGTAPGPYDLTKILAERLVLSEAAAGLPAIVVNPSAPIGPWDSRPTPTGRLVLDIAKRRLPAYVSTGLNLVDVEAVAEALVSALSLGRVGERYILGGVDLPLREVIARIAAVAGVAPTRLRLPLALAHAAALLDDGALRPFLHHRPRVPLAGVRAARAWLYFDASKAKRELGLRDTDLDRAVTRALAWFRERCYL